MKCLLAFLCSFCTLVSAGQAQEAFIIPKPTGPWSVGKRLLEWTDASRTDSTAPSGHRVLPVWVWYPTDKKDSVQPGYSLPVAWRKEQAQYLDQKLGSGGASFIQNLKVWAVKDANPVSSRERFPVLVFGPGYTWLPTDYATIIEDMVSHGYIVVGYVPTGLAGVTQLASGQIVKGTLPIQQQDISFDDAFFVRNNLYRLTSGWLQDHIDLTRVGIFGHSQGGVAATVVASRDTSIKAFVNLDGDLMGSALNVKVTQPSLLLSNDERVGMASATGRMDLEGRERSEYRRHADYVRATDKASVALRVRLTGIRHLNFTDLGLAPAGQMTVEEMKNKIGQVNGAEVLSLIAELTRAFFDTHLKHAGFPTMVELERKYPQAVALLWKGLPTH
ncbi:MAG: alpha/beta hydrolase family protein [Flavisolibacter sp.]